MTKYNEFQNFIVNTNLVDRIDHVLEVARKIDEYYGYNPSENYKFMTLSEQVSQQEELTSFSVGSPEFLRQT